MVGYEGWPLVINFVRLPPCKDKTIQDFISSLFTALFFYIFIVETQITPLGGFLLGPVCFCVSKAFLTKFKIFLFFINFKLIFF